MTRMTREAATEKNYTEAQEKRIADFAAENGGTINSESAGILATEFNKNVKSVIAKAVRMSLYKAKEKVSKTGGKVESKEQIVLDIASIVGKNMEGLEKAPKLALQILRERLSA